MPLTKSLTKAIPSVLNNNVTQWELTMTYDQDGFEREFSDIIEQTGPDGSENFPLKPALSFTKPELEALYNTDHMDLLFNAHLDNFLNPPVVSLPVNDFDINDLPLL